MAASIDEPAAIAATAVAATPGRRMWLATWSQTEFKIGLVLFLLLVGTAFIYPLLSDIDPTKLSVRERFLPPVFLEGGTWAHPLGTDQLGRDLFVRSLVGLQNALMISVAVVVLMFAFGATVGLVAGYRGGWISAVLMRTVDGFLSYPTIFLLLALAAALKPSPVMITIIIAVTSWMEVARIVEAEVRSL